MAGIMRERNEGRRGSSLLWPSRPWRQTGYGSRVFSRPFTLYVSVSPVYYVGRTWHHGMVVVAILLLLLEIPSATGG